MPLLISSSAFYSLNDAPGFLQIMSKFNPFQWFVSGLRDAIDLSWFSYFTNLGLLFLLALLTLLLALRTFRFSDV